MNIALFGLSADPPHLGHLAVARAVREMGYQRVWFTITPQNPTKPAAEASYWHRRELGRLLTFADADWLEICDFQAGMVAAGGELRTRETLQTLHKVMPDVDFTVVIGADNWADPHRGFHTWEGYHGIFEHAGVVILPRGTFTALVPTCLATREMAHRQDTAHHGPVPKGRWRLAQEEVVYGVQSRDIRTALRAGEGSPYGLSAAQVAYIRKHGLYA